MARVSLRAAAPKTCLATQTRLERERASVGVSVCVEAEDVPKSGVHATFDAAAMSVRADAAAPGPAADADAARAGERAADADAVRETRTDAAADAAHGAASDGAAGDESGGVPPAATESSLRARIVSALSFLAQDVTGGSESEGDGVDTPLEDASSASSESRTAERAARSVGRWEDDQDVAACHKCARRFTFFLRKHHCRRCGRIFCDACTSQRAHLRVDDLVIDPAVPEMLGIERVGPSRVCDWCVAAHDLIPEERAPPGDSSLLHHVVSFVGRARAPEPESGEESGESSVLEECPVCDRALRTLPSAEAREAHVMHCLEHGAPADVVPRTRYVASRLAPDSVLLGSECIICMEEFLVNDAVARLNCLCCFHRACIDAWLRKSHGCPTHAPAT